jgi:hypothetical protein
MDAWGGAWGGAWASYWQAGVLVDVPGTACARVFAPWIASVSASAQTIATAEARPVRDCDD